MCTVVCIPNPTPSHGAKRLFPASVGPKLSGRMFQTRHSGLASCPKPDNQERLERIVSLRHLHGPNNFRGRFEWKVRTSRNSPKRSGLVFSLRARSWRYAADDSPHSLDKVEEEFMAKLSHISPAILAVVSRSTGDHLDLTGVLRAVLMHYRDSRISSTSE